jgi:hypothetical protein
MPQKEKEMRRFIPFMILALFTTTACVVKKKVKETGRSRDTSHLAKPLQTCPVQVTAQAQTAVSNAIFIDKGFSPGRLRRLHRALDLLRQVANKDRRGNHSFRNTGDLRLLKEFLEDSRIRIHYDPMQEYSEEGPTIAYTQEEGKRDIYVQPYAWRLSRRELARALVHEFTHITLTPHPGQEGEAQLMEVKCGFRKHMVTPPIGVTASPTAVPLLQFN